MVPASPAEGYTGCSADGQPVLLPWQLLIAVAVILVVGTAALTAYRMLFSPASLAGQAADLAWIAGRPDMREPWHDALEASAEVSTAQARLTALSLLRAAVRLRLGGWLGGAWRPVDWVLVSPSRTQALTAIAVGADAVYIEYANGLTSLLTDGWGWCGSCGLALMSLTAWLRRVRSIELAERRRQNDRTP
ncbi:hypothetical protein ABZX65_26775 [Streptomyces sp. NPDC003300]|uniref:hypothetical protein n=1 Tax=unclassified Streptomyces TaxID=2593676 RepID=UPI0033A993AF